MPRHVLAWEKLFEALNRLVSPSIACSCSTRGRSNFNSCNEASSWMDFTLAYFVPSFYWLDDQRLCFVQGGKSQDFAQVFHAGGPFNPWVKPFVSSDQNDFKCIAQDKGKCVSLPLNQWHGDWAPCQASRPRWGWSAWDFSHFASFLIHLSLHAQLIQNLWNFIRINKICMEHDAKLYLFLRSWQKKCDLMAVNTPPSLNSCSSSSKAKT
jgi:hypothetical protein